MGASDQDVAKVGGVAPPRDRIAGQNGDLVAATGGPTGEVLTAFARNTVMMSRHQVRTIDHG